MAASKQPIRHPLAERLYQLRQRKFATEDELIATLEMAQLETEKLWESGEVAKMAGIDASKRTCERDGCNYSRYPASKFCMAHVSGNDTFAARLRGIRKRQPN
ncbi:MAG: hypothetical protein FD144_148 [Rhodospirillaceae bacterium]|nr:MAG: hypothetical protein FD144_148 [Rhodospirillaceae bacterium]